MFIRQTNENGRVMLDEGSAIPGKNAAPVPEENVAMSAPARDLKACSTLTLLAEARSGNDRADEVLCERYWLLARNFVRGRLPKAARGHMDTEDVVQDLFLKLFPLSSFHAEHSGALRGFFKKSLLNRLIDVYRAHGRRPRMEALDVSLADGRSLWDSLVASDTVARYERALSELNSRDQQIVMARVELGLSFKEIAAELDIADAETTRSAFRRAFKKVARAVVSPD